MRLSSKTFVSSFLHVLLILLLTSSPSAATPSIRHDVEVKGWGQLQLPGNQRNFRRARYRLQPANMEEKRRLHEGTGGMSKDDQMRILRQKLQENIEHCKETIQLVKEENDLLRTAKVTREGVTFGPEHTWSAADIHDQQEWWNKAVRWPRKKFVKDKLFRGSEYQKGAGDMDSMAHYFVRKDHDRAAAQQLVKTAGEHKEVTATNRGLRQHIYDQFQVLQGVLGNQVTGQSAEEVGGSGTKSSGKGYDKSLAAKDVAGHKETIGDTADQSEEVVEGNEEAGKQSAHKKKKKKKKKKSGHN